MNMAVAVQPEEVVPAEVIACPVDIARAFVDVIKGRAPEGVSVDREVTRAENGLITSIELSASIYDATNQRKDVFHSISIGREVADDVISAAIRATNVDPAFKNIRGVNVAGCNLTMALVDFRLGRG